ncbi:MAG: sodium:solute symporter [Saprospiraceae bacterium]
MSSTYLPYIILGVIAAYFLILTGISNWVSKGSADNDTFFLANRRAPWFLVTIGLIGASISGVTFVSIPGKVGTTGLNQAFSYLQLVFGYVAGYIVIALVLMPVYYKMKLVSIYGYLENRFGLRTYKTGAAFFLISRTIGTAFRMFLMVLILQQFALSPLGVPVYVTAFCCIFLVWFYTYKGGTKTILYTDVLLTFCFLGALVMTIFSISSGLGKSISEMTSLVWNDNNLSQVFFFKGGWSDPNNFFKQFISGALITITMTGLDQDLMQKNLACKNIGEAQKNMFTFSGIIVVVNLMFLFLGGFLYLYASRLGITAPSRSDLMYPTLAFSHLGTLSATIFVIGIVASTFSSSDSALTALTTAFCIDFLDFNKKVGKIKPSDHEYNQEKIRVAEQNMRMQQKVQRFWVHIGMSAILFVMMMVFAVINNQAIIDQLFKAAGYTYGPLLGLFAFGFLTNRFVNDGKAPLVCILSPLISFFIDNPKFFGFDPSSWLWGFNFGFLILLFNGLLTFGGLWIFSKENQDQKADASRY